MIARAQGEVVLEVAAKRAKLWRELGTSLYPRVFCGLGKAAKASWSPQEKDLFSAWDAPDWPALCQSFLGSGEDKSVRRYNWVVRELVPTAHALPPFHVGQ